MTHQTEAPRLLGLPVVIDRTSLSEATLRRMIAARKFPPPVKVSTNRIAWREPEVDQWVASRPVAA